MKHTLVSLLILGCVTTSVLAGNAEIIRSVDPVPGVYIVKLSADGSLGWGHVFAFCSRDETAKT